MLCRRYHRLTCPVLSSRRCQTYRKLHAGFHSVDVGDCRREINTRDQGPTSLARAWADRPRLVINLARLLFFVRGRFKARSVSGFAIMWGGIIFNFHWSMFRRNSGSCNGWFRMYGYSTVVVYFVLLCLVCIFYMDYSIKCGRHHNQGVKRIQEVVLVAELIPP